jgi:hypothetical protein
VKKDPIATVLVVTDTLDVSGSKHSNNEHC